MIAPNAADLFRVFDYCGPSHSIYLARLAFLPDGTLNPDVNPFLILKEMERTERPGNRADEIVYDALDSFVMCNTPGFLKGAAKIHQAARFRHACADALKFARDVLHFDPLHAPSGDVALQRHQGKCESLDGRACKYGPAVLSQCPYSLWCSHRSRPDRLPAAFVTKD